MKGIGDLCKLLSWIKENDLPNWLSFGLTITFSFIFWPTLLTLWERRTVMHVPGLEVKPTKGTIKVNGKNYDSVDLHFLNNTGSILYITHVALMKCSSLFVVSEEGAARNISGISYDLQFLDIDSGKYTKRQVILQTNEEVHTTIAVDKVDEGFLSFKPSWIRRRLHIRKYFNLHYVAVVGVKRYSVKTIY